MIVRMLRIVTAGAMFLLAAGVQAQEQTSKPWYIAVGGGAAWYSDQTVSGAASGTFSMDTGYGLNAAIGRYLDDIRVLRLELESVYESADINNFNGVKADGSTYNYGLMFNLLYDIHTDSKWIPYIGGGFGWSQVTVDKLQSSGTTLIDDSDAVFAWQFKGGIEMICNGMLAAAGDEDQGFNTSFQRFLHCILDQWFVDHRQHFFWNRLGCW